MRLGRYILMRLALAIPLILAVSFLTLWLIHKAPGSPADVYVSARISPLARQRALVGFGLGRPMIIQFVDWWWGLGHGHLGVSLVNRQPVATEIGEALPYTLWLVGPAVVVTAVVAVAVAGVRTARPHSWLARALGAMTLAGMIVPDFWVGMVLIAVVAIYWPAFPIGGIGVGQHALFGSGWMRLTLPVLVLVMTNMGSWARYLEASLRGQWSESWVRLAYAKGLSEIEVFLFHLLPSLLIPLLTLLGSQALPALIGGAVIIETLFNWPGMGRLLWTSVIDHNYPVILPAVVLLAAMTIVGNLLADIGAYWLDPRRGGR